MSILPLRIPTRVYGQPIPVAPDMNEVVDKVDELVDAVNAGLATSNAIVGGPKFVRYTSSQYYGVGAVELTLDRLDPATVLPGNLATVINSSATPTTATAASKGYIAVIVPAGTAGAFAVPAYLGAPATDTVLVAWQEVVDNNSFTALLASELAAGKADYAGLALRPLLIKIIGALGTGKTIITTQPPITSAPAAPTAGQVDDTADTFSFLPNPAYPSFAQYKVNGLPGVTGAVVLDGVNSYVQGSRIYVKVVGAVSKGGLAVYVAGSGSVPDGAVLTNADPFTGVVVVVPSITGFSPASAAAGASITLTGTNFTGATSVLFNGTAASFTVLNATTATAIVPAQATSGPVSLATSAGTGTSAASFTVQAANRIPVADAGQDVTIQLPTNSVALMGTGSDPDAGDSIAGYAWRQITGPGNVGALPATTQNVVATGLVAGTYQFGFRTTDTHGAQSIEDFVLITVQAAGISIVLTPTAASLKYNTQDLTYTSGKMYSALASYEVDTTAPSVAVRVNTTVRHNFGAATAPVSQASVSVFVNGSFVQALVPDADNAPQDFTVSLPGTGTRRLSLVYGLTSRAAEQGDTEGTIVQQVTFPAGSTATPVAWNKKPNQIATFTDSIGVGFGTDTPGREAYIALLRARHSDTDLTTMDSYGAKRAVTTFGSQAAINAHVAALQALFDGSTTPRVLVALGINDYFSSTSSPADCATAIGNFCDALYAAYPNAIVLVATPIITANNEGTQNGLGFTPAQYRTAIAGVRTTPRNAYVQILDAKNIVPAGNLRDGIHPDATGNALYADALEKTVLFGSPWKGLIFNDFKDAEVVESGNTYTTTATDNAQGHRALANVYAPASKYLSAQFYYPGPGGRNGTIGLHTKARRTARAGMAFSLYVNEAGKLVFGAFVAGAYQVLNDSVTAVAGTYYVLNRNSSNNTIAVLSGTNPVQLGQYSVLYSNTSVYTDDALYPVLDIRGTATASLVRPQADAGALVSLTVEDVVVPPPADYTGAVAPYFVEDEDANTNYQAATGPWFSFADARLRQGAEAVLGAGDAGTRTLRGWARGFRLWADTYNNQYKGLVQVEVNGQAITVNQQQDNPNGAGVSWAYYTSPMTAWQEYTVIIQVPAGQSYNTGFDGIEWLG